VDSVEDAIVCYLTTGLHYLVIGDYCVCKKEMGPRHMAMEALAPSLPNSRRLVKRKGRRSDGKTGPIYEIEGTMSHFFARPVIEVTTALFHVLMGADGKKSLAQLFQENDIKDDCYRARIREEMHDLWAQRIVILRPQHLAVKGNP
ncbi:MAG: hypothetical protein WAL56_07865, partial [Candidatus Sulfotelmatobacter sp.]